MICFVFHDFHNKNIFLIPSTLVSRTQIYIDEFDFDRVEFA